LKNSVEKKGRGAAGKKKGASGVLGNREDEEYAVVVEKKNLKTTSPLTSGRKEGKARGNVGKMGGKNSERTKKRARKKKKKRGFGLQTKT